MTNMITNMITQIIKNKITQIPTVRCGGKKVFGVDGQVLRHGPSTDSTSSLQASSGLRSGQVLRHGSGQVAMETAAAIIAVFVFFLGVIQIFIWLSSVMVKRQQYYQGTRINAAMEGTHIGEFSYSPPELNIFAAGGE